MTPEPHPEVEPLAFLIGRWRGEGKGSYPTIESFSYGEEVHFWHVGKPFLLYTQRTWAIEDERPMHSEMGYWRPQQNGGVELVLAHPTGLTEIELGAVTGTRVELASADVSRAPTAKDVRRLERTFHVADDLLTYDVRMAAVGVPTTHHLHAELRRVRE